MKILLLISFSLIVNIGWCQSNVPNKHQMAKTFRIDDEHNEWIICNQDSSFFKSDTLRLYSNINYFYQKSDCCKLVRWNFYKKNSFACEYLQICKEPPTGSVLTENDYFKIKIDSDKSGMYLYVLNQKEIAGFFKIIDFQEIGLASNNSTKVITLKRAFTNKPIIGFLH